MNDNHCKQLSIRRHLVKLRQCAQQVDTKHFSLLNFPLEKTVLFVWCKNNWRMQQNSPVHSYLSQSYLWSDGGYSLFLPYNIHAKQVYMYIQKTHYTTRIHMKIIKAKLKKEGPIIIPQIRKTYHGHVHRLSTIGTFHALMNVLKYFKHDIN